MRTRIPFQAVRVFAGLAVYWFSALSGGMWPSHALAQSEQPIAYIGHGAFFDHSGNQIPLTQAFVEQAQAWYRKDLLIGLDTPKKKELARFERRLHDGVKLQGQERLVVQQRSLEWLLAHSLKYRDDDRTLGKLRALEYALSWQLPKQANQDIAEKRKEFKLNPKLVKKLGAPEFQPSAGIRLRSATVNKGQAYIDECMAAKVPIPPSINQMDPAGVTGWKSQGFIPTAEQFIVGTPAEVRTYRSTTPAGMCYALPRYTDATKTTVSLDGVICLSQETSKVCFWDNQMNGSPFSFPAGTRIPIGVPNTTIDPQGRYQGGGAELAINGSPGGVCTDCHAGENPYITHPKSNLGRGVLWESLSMAPQNLPTFAPKRYDPLVAASWPQNQFSQAGSTVPNVCKGCHIQGGSGRFPHLSNQLLSYCGTVLTQAYHRTMPIGSPGSQIAAGDAFKNAWCNAPPNMASADGDPPPADSDLGSIWESTGVVCTDDSCPGWKRLDNNSKTLHIAAGGNALYQLHNDGWIWRYTGTPCSGDSCAGWQRLDNNGNTSGIVAAGNKLYQLHAAPVYQLHNDGRIWRYTGPPCSGESCPGWQQLDNNPKTVAIVAAGRDLFQLHNDGWIWRYTGTPCNGESCPSWERLDNNGRTKAIAAAGRDLYQLHTDGRIWRYTGIPCNGESCPHWQQLDNNPKTVAIVAAGRDLFQLHNDGWIWRYTGTPCNGESCPGWERLDNNGHTKAIAAAGRDLYQLHTDGRIWRYTGIPCNGESCPHWQQLDNNPKTVAIVAAGRDLFQLHNDGWIWRYTGTPCNGESCPGWHRLDNNPHTTMMSGAATKLFQLHDTGAIWKSFQTVCNGDACPGWQRLDNNPRSKEMTVGGFGN